MPLWMPSGVMLRSHISEKLPTWRTICTAQSLFTPNWRPSSPVRPMKRCTSGFTLSLKVAKFCDVIPSSSAVSCANRDQRTKSKKRWSPLRTTGPNGSFEMISGRSR